MALGKLLLQTRKGFERVVLRHRHRVYGYACHMLGDVDEAADVTQEVFLRLWASRTSVDEKRVVGWLLFVTRNACIDALRHRQTVRAVISRNDQALDDAVATGSRPDASLELEELQHQLQRALQRLSEPHRSIVILREIQEMSYAEICAALDLPMTTVKVYLHRARKLLREEVTDVLAEGRQTAQPM